MINLDEILNQGVDMQFLGKQFKMLQPTIAVVKQMAKLEKEMNDINAKIIENAKNNKVSEPRDDNRLYDIRCKITLALLNNNDKDIKFKFEDVKDKLPLKIQVDIYTQVAKFMYDLKNSKN